jgi:glutathione synthase/RimK-type ligase-like ATP-grasp enzyme
MLEHAAPPRPLGPGPWDVVLLTFKDMPGGAIDDIPLYDALVSRGLAVRFADWRDQAMDWTQAGAVVFRSPWDYFHHPEEFRAWLDAADFQTRLINPAAVAHWNMDKRYFADLEARGVRITPTAFVKKGEATADLSAICAEHGWSDIVVKPTVSGAAFGTRRFTVAAAVAGQGAEHLAGLLDRGDAMIQPYLAAVETERERSLTFVGGRFSHAVGRAAFNPGGANAEIPLSVSDAEIAFAHEALDAARAAVGCELLYARVDLLPDADGPILMEIELIEPSLFFKHRPQAAEDLADLLAREVRR